MNTHDDDHWRGAVDTPASRGPDELPDEAAALTVARAARADPERALQVWQRLDARIVRGGHAAWGYRVIGQLLADGDGVPTDGPPAAAASAYLTTWAECRHRDGGAPTLTDGWARAWSGVRAVSDPLLRASLMVRIASGATVEALGQRDRAQQRDTWIGRLYAVLTEGPPVLSAPAHLAPVIAAVLACVDAVETHPDPFVPANPWLERLAVLAAGVPRGPERALALVCVGRLARHRQDVVVARRHFEEAGHVLLQAPERDLVACLHWPRIHVPCSPALDVIRGMHGLEPVVQTLRRLASLPPLSRTVAANRLDALGLLLASAVRPAPPGATPEGGVCRVADPDLARPARAAHVQVLPHAAARALEAIDAGHAVAGLDALEILVAALDTCGNAEIAVAVRAAQLSALARLRLQEATDPALPAPAPLLEAGEGDEPVVSHGTRSTRAVRHAYWRSRHAFDDASRLALAAWGRAYLLAAGPDGEGEWARASVALDLVECAALGIGVEIGSSGLVAPIAEDWWRRHPGSPDLALRLWTRAFALGVAPTPPAAALTSCVGPRRAAGIAEEEGALLALRLPHAALHVLQVAATWYRESGDHAGLWRTAILGAMTAIRAGGPAREVDLRAVREAHDGWAQALATAGADPLPGWQAVTTRALTELLPSCGRGWVPWLQRGLAVQRWCEHGARPEDVFGPARGLPLELRGWPRQAGV